MIDWDNIGWGDSIRDGIENNDNVLDINNHIIISGIVTKWQFNKGNTYFLVTLDHGNGTETVIAIDSSIKLDIEANDYLKCCADLNAFNTDHYSTYRLFVFNQSDIIQHIHKNTRAGY